MQVVFLAKFSKDLDKVKSKKLKTSILEIVENLENTNDLKKITNLTKLKGHNTAYRIRIGDYRLGLFIEKNNVLLARFVHRKDVYRLFP
jgi:mRNA interferase RelE/StbE